LVGVTLAVTLILDSLINPLTKELALWKPDYKGQKALYISVSLTL